jgi:hypothetical protein
VLPRRAMLALPESRSSPLAKSKKKTHRIEQEETSWKVQRIPYLARGCCGPSWTGPQEEKTK